MKIKTGLILLCAVASAYAEPQEESVIIGYGDYPLSQRFKTCIKKELQDKTFAQQELECIQEELKDVKSAMEATAQDIITLMKTDHWEDRLTTFLAAQKEFDAFVEHFTESALALYGSRMAGFAHYYEAIDFVALRHKHLQHLLEYYQGFKSADHTTE